MWGEKKEDQENFYFIYVLICCTGSLLLCGLSLVMPNRGYFLVAVLGLLITVASVVVEHGL